MLEKEDSSKRTQVDGPAKVQSVVPLPAGMTRSGTRFDEVRPDKKRCAYTHIAPKVSHKVQKSLLFPITIINVPVSRANDDDTHKREDLSAYEKSRLANIKRNQEILVTLGLAAPSEPTHAYAAPGTHDDT
jgi:hypothetical protein